MKVEPIPTYGDLFTIEEFYESVLDGGFNDDDGNGCYANKEKNEMYRNQNVICEADEEYIECAKIEAYEKGFTHVIWFNR